MRLQHLYGPKDSSSKFATWLFNEMLSDVKSISLSKGTQKRDFIYVADVVSAYMHLLDAPCKESFNQYDVGTGKLRTVREFVETMRSELERQLSNKIIPKLGFGEEPYREGELDSPVVDIKGLTATGWMPAFNLSDGLNKTISSSLLNSNNNTKFK